MITSLFEYAAIVQDEYLRRGKFYSHLEYLEIAANRLVDGYLSYDDAMEELNSRFNAWGFEVAPGAIYDAVNFLRSQNLAFNRQNKLI